MEDSTPNLRSFLSHSMIYWFGTMLSKSIGFLLIPLYTRYLVPSDYGTLELVSLTTDVLAIFIGAQLNTAVFKLYHSEEDDEKKKKIISTAVLGVTAITAILFGVLSFFTDGISQLIFGTQNNAGLFTLMFIGYFFALVLEIPLSYLRILDRSRLFVVITFIQLLTMVSLNVFFVVVMGLGVFGVLLGTAISFAITCVILVWKTLRITGVKLSVTMLLGMLQYSLPLVPGALGMFAIHFSDRFILNKYSSLDEVGIYSLAYKFGFLITPLVVRPFYLIWQSKMFEFYNSDRRDEIFNRVLTGFSFTLLSAFILVSVFIDETVVFMTTEKYYAAANFVPIIAAAYVLNGLTQIFLAPLYAEKKTMIIGKINLTGAILNVSLNLLLIPSLGAWGAAATTLVSFMFITVATVKASKRISIIQWEWTPIIKLFIITLVTIAIAEIVPWPGIWWGITGKTILLCMSMTVLISVGYFRPDELQAIRGYLERLLRPIALGSRGRSK